MPFRPPSVLLLSLLVLGLPALAQDKPTSTANASGAASQKAPGFHVDVLLAEDAAGLKNLKLAFSASLEKNRKSMPLAAAKSLSGRFLAAKENKVGKGARIEFEGKDAPLFTAEEIKAALPALSASPEANASLEFVVLAGDNALVLDYMVVKAKDLQRYLGLAENGGLRVTLHRDGNTAEIIRDQTTFEGRTK